MTLVQSYYPDPTTYNIKPSSPYLITFWPKLIYSIDIASITMFISSSPRAPKSTDLFSNYLIDYLVELGFSITFGTKSCFLLNKPYASALIPCRLIFFWFFFCFIFYWNFLFASYWSYWLSSESEWGWAFFLLSIFHRLCTYLTVDIGLCELQKIRRSFFHYLFH